MAQMQNFMQTVKENKVSFKTKVKSRQNNR